MRLASIVTMAARILRARDVCRLFGSYDRRSTSLFARTLSLTVKSIVGVSFISSHAACERELRLGVDRGSESNICPINRCYLIK